MLFATSAVLAVEAGPDNPRKHYWLRNTGARVVEAGPMDARLREIADAFGLGDYGTCRRVANTLLDSTKDPALRAEAAGFLMQSHLAEGDFESARAAAERINDAESLARINGIEANYKAEVGRLQRIIAMTTDPAEAARAQLLTARAHACVGRRVLAEESYWKVIGRHSQRMEARRAVAGMSALLLARNDMRGALAGMKTVMGRYPNTEAAAEAQFCTGEIHRLQGDAEKAEAAFVAAARSYRSSPVSGRARDALAMMHYARGADALAKGETASSLESYRKGVHADPNPTRKAQRTYRVMCLYYTLERWEEARAAGSEILKTRSPGLGALREETREVIADTYYREGLYQEALERYQSLLAECQDPIRREGLPAMVAEVAAAVSASEGESEARPAE